MKDDILNGIIHEVLDYDATYISELRFADVQHNNKIKAMVLIL